ncbi:Arc family DNA-binding protein [Rhizobium sp. PL01]|uniref:Arc family DNA-binding protein n=1 Tax=Rhizobium sp. PL01 TaxID=3085631 RepID=UPI002980E789|nr:Arc family DNA-binding protein [Rhizobium sp. PL01]MDW5313771.1 Arc family DNA-binding protein [Rhizobium sp. PL01]
MVSALPDFKVRMSADVKEQLEAAARVNNRSLNKEIVARLEASLVSEVRNIDSRSAEAARRLLRSGMGDDLEKRVEYLETGIEELVNALRNYMSDGKSSEFLAALVKVQPN